MTALRRGDISFWYSDIGGLPLPRPALDGDATADVCIIGAGYTGLWAAYYLKQAQPELDVLVIEKDGQSPAPPTPGGPVGPGGVPKGGAKGTKGGKAGATTWPAP